MDDRFRVGVIGLGHWAQEAHLPALQSVDDTELVAVADQDAYALGKLANERPEIRRYSSGGEMMANEDLDLVIVATPDDQHFDDVRAVLDKSTAVLCEKPLSTSVDEARELYETATALGVPTRLGFTLRFAAAVQRLHEIVTSGEIGNPQHMQAFQQNGQFIGPNAPFHWKMDRLRTGGGAIVEYGVHTLDLARWIMGDVNRIVALSKTLVPTRHDASGDIHTIKTDDATSWMMEFACGATASCHASWATVGRGPGLEVRVYGTSGAVKCVLSDDLPGSEGVWLADSNDQRFLPLELPISWDADEPWWRKFQRNLLEDFVAELRGAEATGPTFADGYEAQLLLDAAIKSASEQCWIDVVR